MQGIIKTIVSNRKWVILNLQKWSPSVETLLKIDHAWFAIVQVTFLGGCVSPVPRMGGVCLRHAQCSACKVYTQLTDTQWEAQRRVQITIHSRVAIRYNIQKKVSRQFLEDMTRNRSLKEDHVPTQIMRILTPAYCLHIHLRFEVCSGLGGKLTSKGIRWCKSFPPFESVLLSSHLL